MILNTQTVTQELMFNELSDWVGYEKLIPNPCFL